MVLLSHLEAYVGHFSQEQLKKVILPQVRGARCGGRGRGWGRRRPWSEKSLAQEAGGGVGVKAAGVAGLRSRISTPLTQARG